MKSKRLILLYFAICMVAGSLLYVSYRYVTATPPGYCDSQQRFISDEEFIRIAIELRANDWKKRGGRETFEYSGRDFDTKNPNCCRVIRDETFPIFNRLLNRQEISVELNNETSARNINGANLNDRLFFNICGTLKGRIEYDWQGI